MNDMNDGQRGGHVDDLVEAYALGALDAEEMARVEDHLEGCAACRALLAPARAAADALLLAAPPATPPPSLRAKVLARIRAEAEAERRGVAPVLRAQPAQSAARQGLLARLLGRRHEAGAPDEVLEHLATLLANPEGLVWEVAGTAEAPGARGQFVGLPGGREAVLVTAGLAPLGPGRAYQVWLLRGGQPVPNALFTVGRGGEGRLVVRSATRLREVDVVAVTPEPASGSPAPTGPIVLAGQLAA